MLPRFNADDLRGPYALVRTVAPALECISLADAKAHLRVDFTDDDTLISGLIVAARQLIEEWTGNSLVLQTWQYSFQQWYRWEIDLPRATPLVSVTGIQYYDVNDTLQTVDPSIYQVSTTTRQGRVRPFWNQVWPSVYYRMDAITVTYTAGYAVGAQNGSTNTPTDVGNIPDPIISAMKLILGHLYENRLEVIVDDRRVTIQQIPMGAQALLAPYKVYGF